MSIDYRSPNLADDLIDYLFYHFQKPGGAYNPVSHSMVWIFPSNMEIQIRRLKNGNGQYLLDAETNLFLGYPYVIADEIDFVPGEIGSLTNQSNINPLRDFLLRASGRFSEKFEKALHSSIHEIFKNLTQLIKREES